MKYLIILSLIFSANSFAVTPIKEGQKSPESGYIFSVSEEKQIRTINEKRLKLEDLSLKQEELNKVQSEKISELEKEVERRTFTTTEKVIYFGLGVLATGISVYLSGKLVK